MATSSTEIDIVKRPHQKSSYSEDTLLQLALCVEDPLYFSRTFVKVQHPLKGALPFIPYPYQERIITAFAEHRFVVALTARQLGKTTCAAAFVLWKAMFTPDTTILITANKFVQALEIMDRIRFGYENLPDYIRAGVIEYNKGTIAFDNGSKIVSRATSSDAGRGLSITLLYCDEFAFVPPNKASEFWTSIQPVLSCVAGDTLVLTDDGFVEIGDLHQGRSVGDYFEFDDLKAFGKDGIEKVSHGYVSPVSDTLIVETERGMRVEVTPHHPLYTLRDLSTGMIRADELKVGDQLRIQFGMNVFGNNHSLSRTRVKTITPELGYILGGLVAEGWINRNVMANGVQRNMISVSNIDEEFRSAFINNDLIAGFREIPSNPSRLSVNSKELVELIEEMGFKSEWRCDTKQVPKRILTSSAHIQASFLRGLFDGDGCASGKVINLTSTSRKLLSEVQLMLLNFGIVSTIRLAVSARKSLGSKLPDSRVCKTSRDSYSLTIAGSQRSVFLEKIGFAITRKRRKLVDLIEKTTGETKVFSIPKTTDLVDFFKTVFEASGKTKKWFRDNGIRLEKVLRNDTSKGVVTHSFLNRFYELLRRNDLPFADHPLFKELSGSFVWDRIRSITPSTNKTYDFTVPGTHSFLQNGILGSNTGGSCIITSTPKSDEDQFAQIWKGAIDNTDEFGNPSATGVGKNGFYAISVPWWEHPERDEEWAKPFRESLGEARFRQEFCCEFVTDDETLINPLTLTRLSGVEPDFYTGQVRWFKDPIPGMTYVVALDPSLGTGRDYSAIQVFELPTMEQVAEWQHNQTAPRGQIRILLQILHFIDASIREHPDWSGSDPEIFWTVENNSIGEANLQIIEDTGEDRFPGMLVSEKKRKGQARGRFRKGMTTDNRRKLSACARFKSLVESGRMTISSKQLVRELKSFVAKETSFSAKPGEHDDLVSATLLCVRMLDIVLNWMNDPGDLKEHIGDDELFEDDALPVVV